MNSFVNLAYIVSCIFFILGIKKQGKTESARHGNFLSMIGMLIAVLAVFLEPSVRASWAANPLHNGYFYALIAVIIGTVIGLIWGKRVQMIAMPELVALFNGFGGLSSLLVALSEYTKARSYGIYGDAMTNVTLGLTIIIGAVTFTGSVLAWAKLAGKMDGKAVRFQGQNLLNALLLLAVLLLTALYAAPGMPVWLRLVAVLLITLISLFLGVTFVIAIGGGDMPIMISLLNSFSGLAASMAGFVIKNNVLIVAGCLVGASGIILTVIMCKAMNTKLTSLLFAKFVQKSKKSGVSAEPKSISVDDAFLILEAASSVVIIPGYGMAVAQAQHAVKELTQRLEENGTEVSFAIHPVAGRMPGHMNVLLAEADVDYDKLKTMDEMNPLMPMQDVAIVIGANDVVNTAAETDESSPIYGMPIIKAYEAKTVFVLKRGKGAGYSGVENELFTRDNTLMLYGDAKATINALVAEFND